MQCQHCGLINGEDDHRCLRCGRRMTGTAVAAPTSYIGATALAMSVPETDWESKPAQAQAPLFQASPQPVFPPSQKVIPFEQIQRQANGKFAAPPVMQPTEPQATQTTDTTRKPPAPPRTQSRKSGPPVGQGNLDFRPDSAHTERILATGVPAQVYGDSRVAPPMQRLTAGAMDAVMVLLGFGVFAAGARLAASFLGAQGAVFGAGKALWVMLAASFFFIALFYGLIWALAKRETAGMNWTDLQLVTFDGSPLDSRNRAIRFVSAWLSYCSGGLGLLWALADEENLAFHDHISKTYPAEKGGATALVRQRR